LIESGAARVYENSAFTSDLILREILPLILNAAELDRMEAAMNVGKSSNAAKELARWGLSCS